MMSERLRSREPNSNANKCYTIFFDEDESGEKSTLNRKNVDGEATDNVEAPITATVTTTTINQNVNNCDITTSATNNSTSHKNQENINEIKKKEENETDLEEEETLMRTKTMMMMMATTNTIKKPFEFKEKSTDDGGDNDDEQNDDDDNETNRENGDGDLAENDVDENCAVSSCIVSGNGDGNIGVDWQRQCSRISERVLVSSGKSDVKCEENERKRKYDEIQINESNNKRCVDDGGCNGNGNGGTLGLGLSLGESNNNYTDHFEVKRIKYDGNRDQMFQVSV